jgi:hypothetical protein
MDWGDVSVRRIVRDAVGKVLNDMANVDCAQPDHSTLVASCGALESPASQALHDMVRAAAS